MLIPRRMHAWLLGTLLLPRSAMAVRYGTEPVRVSLGHGASADRVARPCVRYGGTSSCFYWRFAGLAMAPGPLPVETAETVALARGGRLVAALAGGEVMVSDDRGASWRRVRFEGPQRALSIAFDAAGESGAAVGTGGAVWTTDDRGETWRLRRDGGAMLIDVAVLGHTLVLVDEHNGVSVSADGGASVRTVVDGAMGAPRVALETTAREVTVHRGEGTAWRVDAGGSVERTGETLHGGPVIPASSDPGHNPAH